ncbi:MAG: DUF2330 domain-containing protein [Actinomycetota bacterium]
MGKRILGITVIIFVMSFLFAAPAYADGGFFGPEGSDISEPEQKAVIFFHEGTEELVLSVRYDGATEDFAWLVPTPEPPVIEESSIALFQLMSTLTPTSADYMKDSYGGSEQLGAGVEVIDELTVGAFDLTVVRAGDAGELVSWLEERGFVYEAEAEGILADYIERGWCFTAMRINPSAADQGSGDMEDEFWQGNTDRELSQGIVDPLRFTFNAPVPVYPLRISSLNPGLTEVLLYVLGPQAYGHASLELEYAERWQPGQIGVLGEFSELAGEMGASGGCCITKLRATFSPDEMEDLYLSPLDASLLEQWPGLAAASQGGDHLPWWAFLLISLAMALVAGITYRFAREDGSNQLGKMAAVFTITLLVSSAVLLPLGIWVRSDGNAVEAAPHVKWPWQDDILVVDGSWSKLIHPDGRIEITGLSEDAAWMMEGSQPGYYTDLEPGSDIVFPKGELDAEGKWTWSIRERLQGEVLRPTHLRVEESASGEFYEMEIGRGYIIDARLSTSGGTMWVVAATEVPARKTETREYAFPSLELVRSITHVYYMSEGEIVLSAEGEPLLAGIFSDSEETPNQYIGFIPVLEENAAFRGQPLVIDYRSMRASGEPLKRHYLDSSFRDATDASSFLLLFGYPDNDAGEVVFVLDTSDGSLYEAGKGYPIAWQ